MRKSAHKIAQMLALNLPPDIACAGDGGTGCRADRRRYRLRGDHLSGRRLAVPAAAHRRAAGAGGHARTARALWLSVETLSAEGDGWLLNQQRYHQAVVLANATASLVFAQTAQLPVYPVGGQVSHIPTTPRLAALRQVLCSRRLPDATDPQNQQHCIGASYHRGKTDTTFSEEISSTTGNG
ncbi:5-methylaminomethyl-2-thiouridine methyltransferase [Klebsiella pneumoniae]|uniref:5-methylaminomethyl-2-thiouridine methyltransferase n=1 Tax=Klebsiella pneumoniae TaxID=573 RepID=A0A377XPW2_KLEPN|nr:5-methylaminomethyl-2-thiouridine methyltransferase [Klebsiella pneumoniae]